MKSVDFLRVFCVLYGWMIADDSEKPEPWDVQRLAALSDGIFAVAMTLLAYNVHVPNAPLTGRQLGVELVRMLGEASGLLMSFAVAAMFWMAHFRLFSSIRQADFLFALINFGLLFSVVLLPPPWSMEQTLPCYRRSTCSFGYTPLGSDGCPVLIAVSRRSSWSSLQVSTRCQPSWVALP